MERRSSPRLRCRIPCEISCRGKRGDGLVVDLSEGGLSVQTALAVEHGDVLEVQLRLPNGRPVEVEAVVWHLRRARRRDSRKLVTLLGLMISKAPDAYAAFATHAAPAPAPAAGAAPAPPPEPAEQPTPAHPELASLCDFRIRVKAHVGPRTRVLCLSAESSQEARALASAELGGDWEVLEVCRG